MSRIFPHLKSVIILLVWSRPIVSFVSHETSYPGGLARCQPAHLLPGCRTPRPGHCGAGIRDSRRFVSQGRIEPNDERSNAQHRPPRFGLVSMVSRVIRNRSTGERNSDDNLQVSNKKPNQQSELERLRRENILLRETLYKLEAENEKLQQDFANRIVIETFEGEGRIRRAREESPPDDFETSLTLMSEEQMLYDDPSQWCDELEEGACPVEPTISFGEALRDRAYW